MEPSETFTVTLSSPTNATISDGSGLGTIANDDSASGPTTVTIPLASGADDVNEVAGVLTADGSDVWLGTESSATTSYAGLRFTNVPIPAGATITSAQLEVVSASTQWNYITFRYGADAAANSAAFSASARPSTRTLVTPTVDHESDEPWVAGTRYPLEDISAVLQAVVNRPGWASGNALSLILRGLGDAWGRKFTRAYEAAPASAARLVVTYTTP